MQNQLIMSILKLIALALASTALTSCEEERILPQVELPQPVQSFISTHFPGQSVLQATKDKDLLELRYDIILNDLTELEFNRKGEIIDMEAVNPLPESAIPAKLTTYVQTNFPDQAILGWELDDRIQELKLNSGLQLEFNLDGDFLRID